LARLVFRVDAFSVRLRQISQRVAQGAVALRINGKTAADDWPEFEDIGFMRSSNCEDYSQPDSMPMRDSLTIKFGRLSTVLATFFPAD
jgi:hypothetical protein